MVNTEFKKMVELYRINKAVHDDLNVEEDPDGDARQRHLPGGVLDLRPFTAVVVVVMVIMKRQTLHCKQQQVK